MPITVTGVPAARSLFAAIHGEGRCRQVLAPPVYVVAGSLSNTPPAGASRHHATSWMPRLTDACTVRIAHAILNQLTCGCELEGGAAGAGSLVEQHHGYVIVAILVLTLERARVALQGMFGWVGGREGGPLLEWLQQLMEETQGHGCRHTELRF